MHFSTRTPSPLAGLHLEFIFSSLEMVQAVVWMLGSAESFTFPAALWGRALPRGKSQSSKVD